MRRTVVLTMVCGASFCIGALFSSTVEARIRRRASPSSNAELLPALTLSPSVSGPIATSSTTFPLSVPDYDSLPGAPATLYLDFTGATTTDWGSNHYDPGTTPAYDIDGDPTTFSEQELTNIQQIWSRVAEMYSPFNINVTTADPGTPENNNAVRVVIGGDGKNGQAHYWYYPTFADQPAGGISYIGSFTSDEPNTSYVFSNNLSMSHPGTPQYVAIAAAHEAGHAFNLQHQKQYNGFTLVQEYSDNDPNTTDLTNPQYTAQPTAPIMGFGYLAGRALWWKGPSTSANQIQNDVGTISSSSNGFGYRPETVGNSIAAASPLPTTPVDDKTKSVQASGVIETIADTAYYSFSVSDPANVAFQVTGAPYGAMLDPSLALYKDDGTTNGQLLQLVNTTSLTELLNAALDPGNYDVVVLSAGVNVGDIGQYFLTGTITVPEPAVSGLLLLGLAMSFQRRRKPSVPVSGSN